MVANDNNFSSIENRPNSRRQSNESESRIIPNFVSLHRHLTLLTRFFLNYMPHPKDTKNLHWDENLGQEFWSGVSTPLYIAASIEKTDCHIGIVDDTSFIWCRPAYEFDLAKAEVTSRFVEEATRFIWSWISFETVTKKMCPKSGSRHLTDKAIQYLNSAQHFPLEGTCELVQLLRDICPKQLVEKALSEARKSKTEEYLNIHLFREIRNSMVHTSAHAITPSDAIVEDPDEAVNDDRVVQLRVASRLILLTIQNLVIGYLFQSPLKTMDNEDGEEYDFLGIMAGVERWQALKFLHLIPENTN